MTDFENNYIDGKAPFYKNLAKNKTILYNNKSVFVEEYNLIVSKRDFGLYTIGLKPNAKWSFNATKKYYGIKGNKDKAYASMQQLVKDYKEFKSKHLTYETN